MALGSCCCATIEMIAVETITASFSLLLPRLQDGLSLLPATSRGHRLSIIIISSIIIIIIW